MSPEEHEVHRRKRVLDHDLQSGNVNLTCRHFGVGRSTFYRWKQALTRGGEAGLARKRPVGQHWPNQLPAEVVEKILHLRIQHHTGQEKRSETLCARRISDRGSRPRGRQL